VEKTMSGTSRDKTPSDAGSPELATHLAELLDWAPGFICILIGPQHVVRFVNRTHRRLFNSHDWVGKPARVAIPDVTAQGFHDLLDDVYRRGERHVGTDLPVTYRASGDGPVVTLYHDFIYEPIRGPDREVIGIYCEGLDVTASHEARAELGRHADRQAFRLSVEQALSAAEGVCGVMSAVARLLSQRHDALRVFFLENLAQDVERMICRAFDPGTGHVSEERTDDVLPVRDRILSARAASPIWLQAADAEGRFVQRVVFPRLQRGSAPAGLVIDLPPEAFPDARELDLLAEVADRTWEAVERTRLAAERDRFFDTSSDLLCIASLRDLRIRRASRSFTTILGWDPEELVGVPSMDLVHPDDVQAAADAEPSLERGAELTNFEQRVRHKDGSYRWISWSTTPVPEEDLLYGVGRDITERKLFDQHRETFIIELDHRVKNTLAVVQSLARQTFRDTAGDPARAVETYHRRLAALALSHDLLTEHNWGEVGLHQIVDRIIVRSGIPARVRVDGPPVRLSPRKAIAVTQALNELAMASAAARSVGEGGCEVKIDWTLAEGDFTLHWREIGGGWTQAPGVIATQILTSLGEEFAGSTRLEEDGGCFVFTLRGSLRPAGAAVS
jgi:PAS domain S-box-containing protein